MYIPEEQHAHYGETQTERVFEDFCLSLHSAMSSKSRMFLQGTCLSAYLEEADTGQALFLPGVLSRASCLIGKRI